MSGEPLVRSVAIVGGGTEAWLAASVLGFVLKPQNVEIRVVETPNRAPDPFGVHAGLASVRQLFSRLGIDENDLLRKTQGVFSLGVEFNDWSRDGRSYFHPYGEIGFDFDAISFHQYWLKTRGSSDAKLTDFSVAAALAKKGRFGRPSQDPASVLSTFRYGVNLDAALYESALRSYAQTKDVIAMRGAVADVVRGETGLIEAVTLDNGERVAADLFIDCTEDGALIGGVLGIGRQDWSPWLPCDRAAVLDIDLRGDPPPFTRATANASGWTWEAPVQTRAARAAIYCSRFASDDEIAGQLAKSAGARGEPRIIQFSNGIRKAFWAENCVALGSAAGFVEPLENTRLHLLHRSLTRLVELFPRRIPRPGERAEYNRLMRNEFERARDMLILHYLATERGEPFWAERRAMTIPETLDRKLRLFKSRGRVVLLDEETFGEHDWVSVLIGQNVIPARYDPLVDTADVETVKANLARMRALIAKAVEPAPAHQAYINAQCRAEQRT